MTRRVAYTRPWLRWLGVGLVLYGLSGILLAGAGAILVSNSFRGVDRLAETIVAQRNVLVLTLDTVASFLANASSGTTTVDATLTDAAAATRQGATLARDLGTAADQVAEAALFTILGQQPFGNVSTSFATVAADARTLGESLEKTAATVESAGGDTARLRRDLEGAATQVRSFSRSLSTTTAFDSLESAFDAPRIVLYGILVWMGVQAAAAAVIGAALIRRPRVEAAVARVDL